MLKELFEKEGEYLQHFLTHIDLNAVQKVLDILMDCKGMMVISGVGKSGLVAEKIAATMTSTGSRAFFLSPINALHGDIGIVSSQDVFVMLGKSGESEELLHLIPYLRNKGVKIISITSNAASRMVKASDFSLILPFEKELCPFDISPTISTTMQMIVGDVLAVALMRLKKFTMDDYALNHPAGRIGRRMITKVKDLMVSGDGVPLCRPHDKLVDVLVELSNKRCGCVLVVDQSQILQGIFTDGDLRRKLQKHYAAAFESPMSDLMTRTPKTIGPEELAFTAMQKMESDQRHPITALVVVNEAKLVLGLIKLHDIVQSGL